MGKEVKNFMFLLLLLPLAIGSRQQEKDLLKNVLRQDK